MKCWDSWVILINYLYREKMKKTCSQEYAIMAKLRLKRRVKEWLTNCVVRDWNQFNSCKLYVNTHKVRKIALWMGMMNSVSGELTSCSRLVVIRHPCLSVSRRATLPSTRVPSWMRASWRLGREATPAALCSTMLIYCLRTTATCTHAHHTLATSPSAWTHLATSEALAPTLLGTSSTPCLYSDKWYAIKLKFSYFISFHINLHEKVSACLWSNYSFT